MSILKRPTKNTYSCMMMIVQGVRKVLNMIGMNNHKYDFASDSITKLLQYKKSLEKNWKILGVGSNPEDWPIATSKFSP